MQHDRRKQLSGAIEPDTQEREKAMRRLEGIDFETRGAGRPLVVLHGANIDRLSMIDALEPAFDGLPGWERIYLDTPGHGASPADGIESNDHVLSRLADFLDAHLANRRFSLIGESRGGYYARVLAHRFAAQVEGLVLIVPAHGEFSPPPEELPEHKTLVSAPELRGGIDPALQSRFDRLVVQNADIVERMTRTKLPALLRLDQNHQAMIGETFKLKDDPDDEARPFKAPTLVVLGRQDSVGGYRHMLGLIESYPRGTFSILDGAGHSLSWERPDLFLALTRDWLERVETMQSDGAEG